MSYYGLSRGPLDSNIPTEAFFNVAVYRAELDGVCKLQYYLGSDLVNTKTYKMKRGEQISFQIEEYCTIKVTLTTSKTTSFKGARADEVPKRKKPPKPYDPLTAHKPPKPPKLPKTVLNPKRKTA